jgi:flagellar biosynthesis/type III secretory pathway protein FliH
VAGNPADCRFCFQKDFWLTTKLGCFDRIAQRDPWFRATDCFCHHPQSVQLPGIAFETAISTIEIISAKTEDKQMYDQREKAQRDYEWAISVAREEGREEGEQIGLAKGKLAGKI